MTPERLAPAVDPDHELSRDVAGAPTREELVAFVDALDAAHTLLRAVADRALSQLGGGVTTTQLRLLERLQQMGESRLIDLADALAIAPSTATRLCDTLADRQLIVRNRRGHDRRELQIHLTDHGIRLLEELQERTAEDWEKLLHRVRPHDLRRIGSVLGSLVDDAESVEPLPEATEDVPA